MSEALVILVPPVADAPPRWWRVADRRIVATGHDVEWNLPDADDRPVEIGPVLLLVPAAAVTLHRALLPDLAPRQAAAAARLMALENSAAAPDTLHIGTGPRDGDGGLDVAVVSAGAMAQWLRWAGHHAIDPDAIVPAPLLLPRPDEGFVFARIGDEPVWRDAAAALADPELAPLIVGDAPVAEVPPDAIEAAMIAAVAQPPLDLRTGLFAKRRRGIDWALVRRAAVLAGLILALSLVISIVRIARLEGDTVRLDSNSVAAARRIAPEVASADAAEAAVNARLTALGLAGRGFGAPLAQLFAALQPVPAVALTALERTGEGTLRATLAAAKPDDINAVLIPLQQTGYVVTADPPQNQGGQVSVGITVAAP